MLVNFKSAGGHAMYDEVKIDEIILEKISGVCFILQSLVSYEI